MAASIGLTGRRTLGAACLALAAFCAPLAHAALFSDDEARRAILDLRQRLDQVYNDQRAQKDEQARALGKLSAQVDQLRSSLLDLNAQIEALRADNARLRGQDEQTVRDVSELQRQQKDLQAAIDDRIRKLEPQKVTVNGREFQVQQDEKHQYEEALAILRRGDFAGASNALSAFQKRYPSSGYGESVMFWLGNAQYGQRNYTEAIASFRALVSSVPQSPRAPEALLAIANCQIELKDVKSARRTIDELVKTYPNSEAAQAGRERLAALK